MPKKRFVVKLTAEERVEFKALLTEAAAWSRQRNAVQIGVNWHFTTEDARTRLKRLYPNMDT